MILSEGHTPPDTSQTLLSMCRVSAPGRVTLVPRTWGKSLGILATPAQAKLPFLLNPNPQPLLQSVSLTLFICMEGKPMGEFWECFGLSFLL